MRLSTPTAYRQGNVIQTLVLLATGCAGAIWLAAFVGASAAHALAHAAALLPG